MVQFGRLPVTLLLVVTVGLSACKAKQSFDELSNADQQAVSELEVLAGEWNSAAIDWTHALEQQKTRKAFLRASAPHLKVVTQVTDEIAQQAANLDERPLRDALGPPIKARRRVRRLMVSMTNQIRSGHLAQARAQLPAFRAAGQQLIDAGQRFKSFLTDNYQVEDDLR